MIRTVAPSFPEAGQTTFLKLPEVCQRTKLSRSEIYRRLGAQPARFPFPVRLGNRAVAWAEHEISAWCDERIAERDAEATP